MHAQHDLPPPSPPRVHARTRVRAHARTHAQTLKGVGGDILYCEEAAYMDIDVLNEVVLPLLEMEGTLLVAISTPLGPDNFYSEFMDLVDPETGEYVFNRVRAIAMCQECIDKDADFCPHLGPSDVPDWKTSYGSQKSRHVRMLYRDDRERMRRETLGHFTASSSSVFDRKRLEMVFGPDRTISVHSLEGHIKPRYIIVCCDPNGGGASHFAATAIYKEHYSNRVVVRVYAHAHAHARYATSGRKRVPGGFACACTILWAVAKAALSACTSVSPRAVAVAASRSSHSSVG